MYSDNTFQVSYLKVNSIIKRDFLKKTDKRIDSKDSKSLTDSQLNFAHKIYLNLYLLLQNITSIIEIPINLLRGF